MGSKTSSAPAPDPRLISAQIGSMDVQNMAIRQMMQNSDDMMPLQKQQLQFGLDASRAAYDESKADRSWMLTRRAGLSDIQDQVVNDAKTYNAPERTNQMLDEANGDVDSAFSSARDQGARGLSRMGVMPGSGRSMMLSAGMDVAQATAKASAATKVRAAARAEGFAMTDRANNALAGYPAMGMSATGAGAGYGAAGLGMANQGLAGMNSGYGATGSMAGSLGQNASGMYGAMGSYKNGADKNAADAAGSTLNTIGGMAGTAAKLYLGSDRRLKTHIVRVGTDKRTGLPTYEFSYKDDPSRTYFGVMADEAQRYMPHAVIRGADGYDRVDYSALGIEFKEVSHV
jgi:hypothetical protein